MTVQNFLDLVAVWMERILALMNWEDPFASTIGVVVLIGISVLMWMLGLRVIFLAGMLFDIRPPRFRDPFPAPPVAFAVQLPSLDDRLM